MLPHAAYDESGHDVNAEIIFNHVGIWPKARFFETSTKFPSLDLLKMNFLKDKIFVLKGCHYSGLLWKQDDHYLHVSTCFILDLMSGEVAAETVETGDTVADIGKIR